MAGKNTKAVKTIEADKNQAADLAKTVTSTESEQNSGADESGTQADQSGNGSSDELPEVDETIDPIVGIPNNQGSAAEKETLKFPCVIEIVNDTGVPYVVTGTYVAAGTTEKKSVMDQDEIIRAETDCEHIATLLDHYKDAEVQPIRVVRPA